MLFGGDSSFALFLFLAVGPQEVETCGFFGRELGCFRNFINRSRNGHFRQQLNVAVVLKSRTGRDEAAHNYVFLEAAEVVHLASNGSFGKDASRLLEAGSRDERICRER